MDRRSGASRRGGPARARTSARDREQPGLRPGVRARKGRHSPGRQAVERAAPARWRGKACRHGIARPVSEALTATLSVRGTALYISPEQVRGDRVDARADLYSLGCAVRDAHRPDAVRGRSCGFLVCAYPHPGASCSLDQPRRSGRDRRTCRRDAREGSRQTPANRRGRPEVSCLRHEPRRADRGDGAAATASLTALPARRRASDPDRRHGRRSSSWCAASPCSCSSRCWRAVIRTAEPRRLGRRRSSAARPRRSSLRPSRPAHRPRATVAGGDKPAGAGTAVAPGSRRDRARYRR